ncbi:FHA domain-containing protein [Sedimenticola selenatireducens]|jgi:predicted component of type VI protein secretion system|uniref:FHA domain-containing protein n=1 Tax=Sedimenticola selenatireducens TaxID=191960 RepID=A0A558E1E7_9GAMM|nr:FHA domain-containing protein [Sedimenticola selenatireducens]TVO79036.1 FHA domain-containing protein [Sedimenticola selenatireducens]TVT67172.1 MAG: FHA domain-containing protein [Sedimenticola selenatireducens]
MPKLTLCFKGRFIGLHNLTETTATIGRAPDAEVHIESLAIAERHAIIKQVKERCLITPIADHKTWINRRLIDGPTQLKHGDIVKVGKHELFYSESATDLNRPVNDNVEHIHRHQKLSPASCQSLDQLVNSLNTLPSGTIQIISGSHLGKIIPLQRGLTRLGLTGNECAVIAHRNDGYYISHLEGDTPPKVNNRSIGNHTVRLQEGVEITLGNTKMRFHEEIAHSAAI